jgi:hypothetical protein
MSNNIFTTEDTALYAIWKPENGGVVVLFIPGVGELQMTFAKAEDLAQDIARQAEYGRWYAMEERHDSLQDLHKNSPLV